MVAWTDPNREATGDQGPELRADGGEPTDAFGGFDVSDYGVPDNEGTPLGEADTQTDGSLIHPSLSTELPDRPAYDDPAHAAIDDALVALFEAADGTGESSYAELAASELGSFRLSKQRRRVVTDGGADRLRGVVPKPREADFVHTKPAIKLSPVATSDVESRVGDVRLECFDDYDRGTRIVIAITDKELKVAGYCGLLVEHPIQDTMIFFGPWDCGQHADEIDCCVVTKYTRPRLESGNVIEYERDTSRNIAFELNEVGDVE